MNKTIALIFWSCFFSCVNVMAQGKKYYLAASGNDNNDGLSPRTAWHSLKKVNETSFKPGDNVLFEGGAVFNGNIKLTSDDNGTPGTPVIFASYGKGRATINAGVGEGLLAINTSYVDIKRLNFHGTGVNTNKGSGIHFFANDSLKAPSNITITECDVKGFNTYGIVFGANDNKSYKGYQYIRVTKCNASENGQGGFGSYGSQLGFQHKDFYMANCKAFNNRGIISKTENHSGNGIVMAMIDGLVIEHCEAFENGANNRCDAGGPVGIWIWMCKNATIQYCTSHNNHAGGTKDGGGFDIDGGASNCVLQYNYAYNNEGAGYLLAEFGALFPFTNNTIRFNISKNDGRKNNYGGISVWGADDAYSVTNTNVYNNTVYVDDSNLINGTPAAVTFMGTHFKNVIIANNIFVTKGKANFINADTVIKKSAAYLIHNDYYSFSNNYVFKYGAAYFNSIPSWLKNNPEQEWSENKMSLLNIDPQFNKPSFDQSKKNGFGIGKTSLIRRKLFSLPQDILIPNNEIDLNGNKLPSDKKIFPGAVIK